MNWRARLWRRVRPGSSDSEIGDEIEFHLEMRAREYEAEGLSQREARERARREFGNTTCHAEAVRETSPWLGWTGAVRDARYALRRMAHEGGFTALIVGTLALGIGSACVVFSVLDAVVLAPLPFEEQGRLVVLWETHPGRGIDEFAVSKLNFLSFSERARSFTGLGAFGGIDGNLAAGGETIRVAALEATPNLFGILGVSPVLGRAFREDEGQPGNDNVAILAHGFWQTRYAGQADVLGQQVELNGSARQIIGVAPARLAEAFEADIWVPMAIEPGREYRGNHTIDVVGRLASGMTRDGAEQEAVAIAKQLGAEFPSTNDGWQAKLQPVAEALLPNEARGGLWFLLGAVGLLLLIACANVANLLLVRASARRQEVAVRRALGAGRGRLIRQYLIESLLLGLAGAVAGTAVAFAGLSLLRDLTVDLPRIAKASLDLHVLLFALGCAVLTSVLFGLAPALDAARGSASKRLSGSARSVSADAARGRLRSALVAGEIALALVLSFTSALLTHSYMEVERTPLGFPAEELLTASVALPPERFPSEAEWSAHYAELLRRLRALPGVRQAGLASRAPFMSGNTSLNIRPYTPDHDDRSQDFQVSWRIVSPTYFDALGIPIRAGETFRQRRDGEVGRELILSADVAAHFWPDRSAVGQQIQIGDGGEPATVVGVVGDIRHISIERAEHPTMYIPHDLWQWSTMTLILRTEVGPEAMIEPLRRVVHDYDAGMPVYDVRTMHDRVRASFSDRMLNTLLLALFAFLALGLAAVGVYGLVSYGVAQRRREIGVRVALGANRGQIIGCVARQGLRLAAAGIVIGLLAARGLQRVLDSMLYRTSSDSVPLTAITAALLLLVTLCACTIPARRAARVEPASALRAE